jgi:hypothetical protein
MLHKQSPTLTWDQCRHIIRGCPTCSTLLPLGPNTGINLHGLKANHIWQTDVTHIPQFGTLKYVHVTVNTYSGVLFATAHTEEATKHALGHLLGAFATFAFFYCFIFHMCIQCLGHFSPLPPLPPLPPTLPPPSPQNPLDTRQKLFCPYL